MVDGVLLLVDAVEGPMPQTRFVTRKALAQGLKPIVVVNKVDRDGARPDWVVNQTFDLMDKLGATEDQLDFPVIYASALNGWATIEVGRGRHRHAPALRRGAQARAGAQGRSRRRRCSCRSPPSTTRTSSAASPSGASAAARSARRRKSRSSRGDKPVRKAKIGLLHTFQGLEKVETDAASAGEIVSVTGIEDFIIGTTFADPENARGACRWSAWTSRRSR